MNAKQIAERLRHGIPDFDTMAEAADLLERMAWQPIETAPIGAMILCADMHAKEAQHWAFVGWRYAGIANGCVTTPQRETQPATHWMPLPDPPSE